MRTGLYDLLLSFSIDRPSSRESTRMAVSCEFPPIRICTFPLRLASVPIKLRKGTLMYDLDASSYVNDVSSL
jgi:hypothetical protein